MEAEPERAYKAWLAQRNRCLNTKNKAYKYYGGKGVLVKYCARAFVAWWLAQGKILKTRKLNVDRLDSAGHYEFGNIRLVSKRANIAEMNRRTKSKPVLDLLTGISYPSITAASKAVKLDLSTVAYQCKGKVKKRRFIYQTRNKVSH